MATLIRIAQWSKEQEKIQEIRKTVFIEEQNVNPEEEWDDYDASANTQHLLAIDNKSGQAVATARFLSTGKIGRVAVLELYRGQGIGRDITCKAVELALEQGIENIYLDAQTHALSFYQELGFVEHGDYFLDAGIEHQRMNFIKNQDGLIRIYRNRIIHFDCITEPMRHMQQQFLAAKKSINIFSYQLRPDLFSNVQTTDALSTLARRSRHSRIRILVRDTSPLRGAFHRLIDLAQRLPSAIEIRKLTSSAQDLNMKGADSHFTSVDATQLVFFKHEKDSLGFAQYAARAEIKQLDKTFNTLWESHSKTDPNLKQISLRSFLT